MRARAPNACWSARRRSDSYARKWRRPRGSDAIVAAGQTNIGELIALLSLCDGFAGNDSGAMHLAAALAIPTVGIFGSTNPERTGPERRACGRDLSSARMQPVPRAHLPLRPLQLPARNRTGRGRAETCDARSAAAGVELSIIGDAVKAIVA